MTISCCPKCGSFNITTAGVCANCGWSQFAQVTLSSGAYKAIDEMELKVFGKALLDDYKHLLFENNSLTARIAELEAENERYKKLLQDWVDIFDPRYTQDASLVSAVRLVMDKSIEERASGGRDEE